MIYSVAVYLVLDHGKCIFFAVRYSLNFFFYFSERVVYVPTAQPMYAPQGYGQPMYPQQGYGQPMYPQQGYIVREPMARY